MENYYEIFNVNRKSKKKDVIKSYNNIISKYNYTELSKEDKKNKKRTLVVLWGRAWGLALLTFELLAPYGLIFYWQSHRLFYLPFFALIFVFLSPSIERASSAQ